jgi:hypothetical protein
MNAFAALSEGRARAAQLAAAGAGADAELPALHDLMEPARATTWLSARDPALVGVTGVAACDLLRYRPGRRATLRLLASARTLYVKVVAASRVRRVLDAHEALGACPAVRAPRVLLAGPADGVLVLSEVPGTSLEDALGSGEASLLHAAAAGRAVAALHASAARARAWTTADELGAVERAAAGHPDVLGRLERVERALRRLREAPPALLHRDLHPGQVLVDGGAVGFVDVDELARGAAVLDVGNLLAHLDLFGLHAPEMAGSLAAFGDAFTSAWLEAGAVASGADLAAGRASALVRLAGVHAGREATPHLSAPLLHLADRHLAAA